MGRIRGPAPTARTPSIATGGSQIVATHGFRYYEDPSPGRVDAARLNDYVRDARGRETGVAVTVSRVDDKLYSKGGDHPQELLVPETCDLLFRLVVERLFQRNGSCQVDALIDRRNNEDLVVKKAR